MLLRRVLAVTILLALAAAVSRAQEPGPGYWERTELPQQGLATYYARGMMEYVYDYRAEQGDISACPECVGTVALLRAGDIGRKVWLQPPGGDPVGPFLVIDCARRQDVQPLLDRNWVVDVSFELGRLWGMNRPLDGVLVFEDPVDAMSVPATSPRGRPTPFVVDPRDVVISPPTATPDPALAAAAESPTPWPTRQPVPLPGVTVVAPPAVEPVPTLPQPPTATPGPPPLTPVITTPTPAVTPAPSVPPAITAEAENAAGLSLLQTPPPVPTEMPTPTPEPEVSIGGAGGGLLSDSDAGASAVSPLATPTRVRAQRTPRPTLTPILPVFVPTPAPATPPEGSFWERILREFRQLLGQD